MWILILFLFKYCTWDYSSVLQIGLFLSTVGGAVPSTVCGAILQYCLWGYSSVLNMVLFPNAISGTVPKYCTWDYFQVLCVRLNLSAAVRGLFPVGQM